MSILKLVKECGKNSFWNAMVFFFAGALLSACCTTSVGSDFLVYKSKIILSDSAAMDTSISVYSDNRGRALLDDSGNPRTNIGPGHPDKSGNIFLSGTTANYDDCDGPPDHWESGPLEVYITRPRYKPFHRFYSKEELKALPQIGFQAAGYEDENGSRGVWVIPDIVLEPN